MKHVRHCKYIQCTDNISISIGGYGSVCVTNVNDFTLGFLKDELKFCLYLKKYIKSLLVL